MECVEINTHADVLAELLPHACDAGKRRIVRDRTLIHHSSALQTGVICEVPIRLERRKAVCCAARVDLADESALGPSQCWDRHADEHDGDRQNHNKVSVNCPHPRASSHGEHLYCFSPYRNPDANGLGKWEQVSVHDEDGQEC